MYFILEYGGLLVKACLENINICIMMFLPSKSLDPPVKLFLKKVFPLTTTSLGMFGHLFIQVDIG